MTQLSTLASLFFIALGGLVITRAMRRPEVEGSAVETVRSSGMPEVRPAGLRTNPIESADLKDLAATLWGEARGELGAVGPDGVNGMEAVAITIRNRVQSRRYPDSYSAVVRQPWQFSVWNENDPNRERLERLGSAFPGYADALDVARRTISGELQTPAALVGVLHYLNPNPRLYPGGLLPTWAATATAEINIGRHRFLKGVG